MASPSRRHAGGPREDAARAAVVRAQEDAAAAAEAARATARVLAQRTATRIAAIRMAFERGVTAQLAALAAEGEALSGTHALTEAELAALERALAKLAAELTQGRT